MAEATAHDHGGGGDRRGLLKCMPREGVGPSERPGVACPGRCRRAAGSGAVSMPGKTRVRLPAFEETRHPRCVRRRPARRAIIGGVPTGTSTSVTITVAETRGVGIDPVAAFEQQMLPHLAAALTLARYLLREPADAEDAVQEAFLQAIRHFRGFRGENAKAWLLTIVRRTCYAWSERERRFPSATDPHGLEDLPGAGDDPEAAFERLDLQERLVRAVDALPLPFREVIVMREIQELSYQEIATISGVPVGTVMSRLARARGRLRRMLEAQEMEG